ncbi:transposase [Mannheimia granulomatis]|uniref:Mu transposase C-terminal domain-containing protein n=1 Tax=Mannheimia granulomatis TaxID=85402 RepID=UPI00159D483E|nr:Mu transposase C-terminal domain-containing protein [Mannheimia granulomatis]QLB14030.1 transposase [Mannheimia granulomatis]
MGNLSLKTHYSVYEIAKFIEKAPKNVDAQAKRENWQSQKRKGRGGGVEYELACLPQEIQTEIRSRFMSAVVEAKPKKLPAVRAKVDVGNLTTKQREIADARMALVAYVLELESSMSRIKAITYLCNLAKQGEMPPHLVELVAVANAKKTAKRTLSVRTLNGWVVDYCKAENAEQRLKLLAPQVRQETKPEEIWWLSAFLGTYRQKNGICLTEAYREFEVEWAYQYADNPLLLAQCPSLSQVQRAMNKLPLYVKEYGRRTGSHYKQLLSYVKRDWSVLRANDVWIGDGHSLKLKVAHPIHGKPFTPELTMIVDGAGRKVVGWSLALSENAFAVADALRHAISLHGVPAIYYSDNGGGEKNKFLDAEITGMLPRLGIRHETGIAGNPQGRGIIERLNKTIGMTIARQFETGYASGADPETVRKNLYAVNSLANAKGGLTPLQRKAQGKLPTWQQLIEVIQSVIDWYNNEHIHSEIRTTPARKYQQMLHAEDVVMLSPIELRDMSRPEFIRKPERGWISWNNNSYFCLKLLDFDREEVVIGIDIHNAESVQVRTKDGRFICEAIWNGNTREAFPVAMVEQQRKERHKRRANLKQQQLDEINSELNPVLTIEQKNDFSLLATARKPKKEVEPIFLTRAEKEDYEKKLAVGG